MGVVAGIFTVICLVVGGYYASQNEGLSIYEKQRQEYERDEKRYYRLVNRAIKKFNKNKPLKDNELKALKRFVNNGLRENPNDLTLQAVKQHIFSDEEMAKETDSLYNSLVNNDNNLYENNTMNYYDNDNDDEYVYVSNEIYNVVQQEKKKKTAERFKSHCDSLTSKVYKHNPAIGREKELEELMIAILTPGKSAIIIGQPRSW